MITPIFPGRYTARSDQDLVVFLIGMRINKPYNLAQAFDHLPIAYGTQTARQRLNQTQQSESLLTRPA